ncbi:MAG TPA: hypothetical protein VL426_03980 [Candidatus Binatia bacterium]|jgi:hypothetical protein|nr:hypothetical protein [Candidatus Binatia bacterium]
MALEPQEQSGSGDEGLEAYSPAVRRRAKKPSAAKEAAPAEAAAPPAPRTERGGGEPFAGLRVSLMPSELEGRTGPDMGRGLMILGLVLVVETIIAGALYFMTARATDARIAKRDELQTKVDDLDKQVAAQETLAKEAAAYNGQVAAAKEALDKHLFWSRFFAALESKTHPTIKYLNFSGDSDSGIVTLDALGKSYLDVAQQIVAFKEYPLVSDVRTTSAAAKISEKGEVTGVSFTLVLKFKPEVWQLKPEDRKAAMSGPSAVSGVTAPPADCGIYKGVVSPYFTSEKPEQMDAASLKTAACINDRFKTCAASTALSSFVKGDVTVTRALELRGPVEGGCQARIRYGDPSAPELDGKDMTCVFDPQQTLASNMFTAENEGIDQVHCAGPLADALKAARAPQ